MFDLKRKHDDAEIGTSADAEANFVKRRRRQPIESGLAALSLSSTAVFPPPLAHIETRAGGVAPSPSLSSASPSPSPLSASETQVLVQPGPEVQMKSSSWYEPEKDRIVILDLDSSSDSGDEGPSLSNSDPDTSDQSLVISPALLTKLRQIPRPIERPKESPEASELALVLFRPPVWQPPSASASAETDEVATETRSSPDSVPMELDP